MIQKTKRFVIINGSGRIHKEESPMRKLDEGRRATILAYINSFYDDCAAPPSVREIAEGTGLPVATVHRYLVDMKMSL